LAEHRADQLMIRRRPMCAPAPGHLQIVAAPSAETRELERRILHGEYLAW
jgi:hypothetical protein